MTTSVNVEKCSFTIGVNLEAICIACAEDCASCKEEIDENGDLQGEDGINMYCTICAAPGDLLICDDPTCESFFCTGCIELLLNLSVVERIKDTDPWECFICNNIS